MPALLMWDRKCLDRGDHRQTVRARNVTAVSLVITAVGLVLTSIGGAILCTRC